MTFESINPVNGEVIASFEEDLNYFSKIRAAELAYNKWRKIEIQDRVKLILNLA